ncbi:hypothetical protein [Saccharopolyspora sp. NPDC002686]|uniref:hypothetical protein n=1 Tax=Saccharopolyspora sp. NPDC002686 TaxID=3154541 RepID=UPI0033194BAC
MLEHTESTNEVLTDEDVAAAMNEARLGPVETVHTEEVDGVVVVKVWLAASPIRARVLQKWVTEHVTPIDATIGKYRASDPVTRFNIRGTDGTQGVLFVLICPFHDVTDRRAVALLNEQISARTPARLVERLARLEEGWPA